MFEAKTLMPKSVSGSYSLESGDSGRPGLTLILSIGLTLILPMLLRSWFGVVPQALTRIPSSLVTGDVGDLYCGRSRVDDALFSLLEAVLRHDALPDPPC